jgi:hypothetical protein
MTPADEATFIALWTQELTHGWRRGPTPARASVRGDPTMTTRTAGMIGWAVLVPLLSTGVPAVPDPASEVCAKVRAARAHQAYYQQLSSQQHQLERLVAERRRHYVEAGYSPEQVNAFMGHYHRQVENGRRAVREAQAAYHRLAHDLSGKVPEPWPACEAPN